MRPRTSTDLEHPGHPRELVLRTRQKPASCGTTRTTIRMARALTAATLKPHHPRTRPPQPAVIVSRIEPTKHPCQYGTGTHLSSVARQIIDKHLSPQSKPSSVRIHQPREPTMKARTQISARTGVSRTATRRRRLRMSLFRGGSLEVTTAASSRYSTRIRSCPS